MAPIKFDEHIKEKLEGRNIQPSNQAWNKLSERLEAQEKNKNYKGYWWLGIAASVIGVLFVVSQFFNNDIKIETTPKVVENPVIIKEDSNMQIANELDKNDAINIENVEKTTNTIKLKTESLIKINQVNEPVVVATTQNINKEEKDIAVKPLEIIKENLSFEEQQIKDVVAKVQSMESNNKIITDADIDALLEQAQKEIRLNKLETTGVVDANVLLQDVEADLNESSFRTRVFEALKSNFNSVKTAIAQRND
tara:strand:- start:1250 stop:2005 length:756 start_codon:yes stop_codon:yes gene_type:complete